MGNFDTSYLITSISEGAYANDGADKGGETYDGISRINYPSWLGWQIIDNYKTKPDFPENLKTVLSLPELVRTFYKTNFWSIVDLDEVNDQNICNELYDISVNMGTGTAAQFLQRSLNLSNRNQIDYPDITVDDKVGPLTVSILNKHPRPAEVFKLMTTLQGAKYIAICEKDRTQEKFLLGWYNRIKSYS